MAQSEEKYVRASERRPPRIDGRSIDVEVAYCEKQLRELTLGMRNLRALAPPPSDFLPRMLAQAAKIRSVDTKLFKLKQGRLL